MHVSSGVVGPFAVCHGPWALAILLRGCSAMRCQFLRQVDSVEVFIIDIITYDLQLTTACQSELLSSLSLSLVVRQAATHENIVGMAVVRCCVTVWLCDCVTCHRPRSPQFLNPRPAVYMSQHIILHSTSHHSDL